MSIKDIILAAVTATNTNTAEPTLPDLSDMSYSDLLTTFAEQAEGITDPDQLSDIALALSAAQRDFDGRATAIRNAETIQTVLPEINDIISSWNESESLYPTAIGENNYWNPSPIQQLQTALGLDPDGVFGPETSRAFIQYTIENTRDGFPYGFSFDASQNYETFAYALSHTPDLSQDLGLAEEITDLQAQLEQRTADHNALITAEFLECTDGIVDLSERDPIAALIQEIEPFSQINDEIEIANQHVADAIMVSCHEYIEMVPEGEREALIDRLTDTLQPALEEYVTMRVHLANLGVIWRNLLDHFSDDDYVPEEPAVQNPQWSEAALKI